MKLEKGGKRNEMRDEMSAEDFAPSRRGDDGRAPGSNIHIEFETPIARDYLILGVLIIWRANSVTSDINNFDFLL
jgi:hypothetical protein